MIRIGIDIDGVLADLVAAFLPHLSEAVGRTVTEADIDQYHMGRAVGLPDAEFLELWGAVEHSLYERALPYEGAPAGLRELAELGTISIQTSRPLSASQTTQDWVRTHLGPEFTVSHREAKTKFAVADGLHAFIDDHLDVIRERHGGHAIPVLLDRPWNQVEVPAGVVRSSDLSDAANRISELTLDQR